MLMSIWGGENYVTEAVVDVRPNRAGGRTGRGDQEAYRRLFPPELGIPHCIDCKGTGFVCVSI